MAVSVGAKPARAKATPVSRERFVMPAGYGGAWPDTEPTRRATHQRPGTTGVEGAGGSGGHGRASRSTTPSRRLACGDLAGGRALRRPEHQRSRKQQAQSRIPAAPPVWRAQEGPAAAPVGGRAWLQRPWVAGPGRGAGGWRQGQGGPRDRPLRAAGSRVAISRAGRRPPAHTAAGPHKAARPHRRDLRRPEHQQHHVVEMGGIEPPSQRCNRRSGGATSSARTLRGIATARHSKRGRHQPTPCASALTHP